MPGWGLVSTATTHFPGAIMRVVLVHPNHGNKIFPLSEKAAKLAEGWAETKISPDAQEDAEAHSERANSGNQAEREERQKADEIDAAGGPEAHAKLLKARAKKVAKAEKPEDEKAGGDAPADDKPAKGKGRGNKK
jgi:hypothetical protein